MKSDREVLEDAIFCDFEDYTAHAAYADLLAELGDPRGEYIRLQLALENASLPVRERRKLDIAATRIYRENFHDWVGHLDFRATREPGPTVRGDNFEIGMRRGWVTNLHIYRLANPHMFQMLAASPELRMLQSLQVDFDANSSWTIAIDAPWAGGLRDLSVHEIQSANSASGSPFCDFLPHLVRLETLTSPLEHPDGENGFLSFPSATLHKCHLHLCIWPDFERLVACASIGRLDSLSWDVGRASVENGGSQSPPDGDFDRSLAADAAEAELAPMPRAIESCPYTPEQLVRLFESPRYRSIRFLEFDAFHSGNVLAEAIVRSGLMANLEELHLHDCGLTEVGARILLDAEKGANLRIVDLTRNPIPPLAVAVDATVWRFDFDDADADIPF